jgi:hypothetical protein
VPTTKQHCSQPHPVLNAKQPQRRSLLQHKLFWDQAVSHFQILLVSRCQRKPQAPVVIPELHSLDQAAVNQAAMNQAMAVAACRQLMSNCSNFKMLKVVLLWPPY